MEQAIGNRKIRVLVVDDSMLARKLIIEGLSTYPKIEIVGYAINAMAESGTVKPGRDDLRCADAGHEWN